MPRKYNNLQGWMRDVKNAMRDGDQVAYELAELLIDVDDLVDASVAASVDATDDDTDYATDGDSDDVDSHESELGEADGPRVGGHASRLPADGPQAGRLGRALDDVAGHERAAEESEQLALRADGLGAAVPRVKRRGVVVT